MTMARRLMVVSLACSLVLAAAAWRFGNSARAAQENAVSIGRDDIGGSVQGPAGPEPGVWVIAETTDLPTKLIKIVVTDERGRFVVPDVPEARYSVWVRGYGLVDSRPVQARPGANLTLNVTQAANEREAAAIVPANYWYSLITPPAPHEFPGTGPSGNGIAPTLQTQAQWIDLMKQGCQLCHQVGNKATWSIPNVETFDSTVAAWDRRVQSGQRGAEMSNVMSRFGRQRGLQMFADWSDRLTAGAVPPLPPRPAGVERNLVLTMWDWANDHPLVHDETATDKRRPTINGYGPIYAVDIANDYLVVLDPKTHVEGSIKLPLRDEPESVPPLYSLQAAAPSFYWGDELIWENRANPHNPMMDERGRVWLTHRIRNPMNNPDFCKEGSDHPSAKYYPVTRSTRQLSYYDPETKKFTLIDTCFGTHHLQFADDENDTLYFSGGGEVVGWVNTRLYDQGGNEQASQGWCPTVIDTNGDGRITKPWNEPVGGGRSTEEGAGGGRVDKFDPKLDTRVNIGSYGIVPDPTDRRAVWIATTSFPGRIARLHLGDNPPETCLTEMFEVPSVLDPKVPKEKTGFGPRGIDIDRKGIAWTALSGSSHFASFDRTKCKVMKGPSIVDGRHCVDGWTLYPTPGPVIPNTDPPVRADFHYYNWVDQFGALGLGENVPVANGSGSDSLLALLPDTGQWVVLRVPYPLGYYTKGLDGRIDDPNAGWKGRGLWASYGNNAMWHVEGGKGTRPKLVHFQVRPNPLAN